jgi:hypothetical protein
MDEKQMTTRYESIEAALNKAHMALIGYLPAHRNAITDAAIETARAALAMPEDDAVIEVDNSNFETLIGVAGNSLSLNVVDRLFTAPQPAQESVCRILLDVVPGPDGMGQEIYATCVEDVVKKLTQLSTEVDELEIRLASKSSSTANAPDETQEQEEFEAAVVAYGVPLDQDAALSHEHAKALSHYTAGWITGRAALREGK